MSKKQKINCEVKNCKFNDIDDEECTLEEINVKSSTYFDNEESNDKDDTICDSFEKSSEYEEKDEIEQEEYDKDIDEIEDDDDEEGYDEIITE